MANEKDPALKISKEIHERVCSMIFSPEGKRRFKNADKVIQFLFQQYDEKIRNKMSAIQNKTEAVKKPFIKYREEFENSLTREELKIYFEQELIRVSEIINTFYD